MGRKRQSFSKDFKASGGGTYIFINCEISNNKTGYSNGAQGYGGGIYIDTTGTVTLKDCTLLEIVQ